MFLTRRGPVRASICDHCFDIVRSGRARPRVERFEMRAEFRQFFLSYRDSTRLRQPRMKG